MKEFIEKLIGRLEEEKSDWNDDYNVPINKAIEIVNRLAEEYLPEINVGNNLQTIDVSELLGESEQGKWTNADKLRAMSDEELAEWLAVIDHYWDDGECVVNFGDAHVHDSRDDILEWLQSEVEEPYD